jgi:hypothetical protein
MQVACAQCRAKFDANSSRVGRATRDGAPLYCGTACAGLARRTPKLPEAERKAAKAQYDREYRERNAEKRRQQKAEYYQRTHDPEKEREIRKARMPQHVEYCRRPEYKEWKSAYDTKHRAAEYGPFADAYLLLLDLEREMRQQASGYERRRQKGYYTRNAQKRRRELWQAMQRVN